MKDYNTLEVSWDVYVEGPRPAHTTIYLEDFEEDMDLMDISECIRESIQEDFEQLVGWYETTSLEDTAKDILKQLESSKGEE